MNWRTHQALKVGRLITLARVNVLPGDSLSIRLNTRVLFAKLRRNAGISLIWETFGFYSPWRWTYGDSFVTAATAGWSTAQTWATSKSYSQDADNSWAQIRGQSMPKHIPDSYAETIDHYFKEPHQAAVTVDNVIQDKDDQRYGYLCWQTRDSWETSHNWADSHDEQNVIASSGSMLDTAKYLKTGRDNQLRTWDAVRAEDIYRATYGGNLAAESQKRPIHLHYERQPIRLNAQQIDPLDVQQIAQAQAGGSVNIPRRYYPEHGTIYIYGLARVKPTYWESIDFLDQQTHFANAKNTFGHPVGASEKPKQIQLIDMFHDVSGSTEAGYAPHYAWYHRRPDWWSPIIQQNDEGWPPRDSPTTKMQLHRHPAYDDIWTSLQFGHALVHSGIQLQGHRAIPSGRSSIQGT